MAKSPNSLPRPRPAIADPDLVRPPRAGGQIRGHELLKLDWNENSDPEMVKLVAGIIKNLPMETPSTYPSMTPLYQKLAGFLDVAQENIVLTAGSDGAIRRIFEAYINPGDDVVLTRPSFGMYGVYARMFGAQVTWLDYQAGDDGPTLGPKPVISAIRDVRPKLVCLPNPDSPTGTVLPPDRLLEIIGEAAKAGSLVIVDEAYYPFYPETMLPRIPDHPNLVVLRSTSKAWAMAGLRIGFAVADAEVASVLHKVRPMFEINSLAVEAFKQMLDHDQSVLASVARLLEGKAKFLEAMKKLNFKTLESEGNFCHVAFGRKAPAIHDALAKLVLYRRNFEEDCLKGFSRFSAAPVEVFKPIIARIAEAAEAD